MAHMVYQQLASAIRRAYARGASRRELETQLAQARSARAWIDGLRIDPALRASVAEPLVTIEESLERLLRTPVEDGE